MKKFFIALGFLTLFGSAGFPQMMGSMHKGEKPHSHMPMMMYMMKDPELKRIIQEHRKKCMQELMVKLYQNPKVMEKLINTIINNPETAKKVLENNPQLKKQLEELLR